MFRLTVRYPCLRLYCKLPDYISCANVDFLTTYLRISFRLHETAVDDLKYIFGQPICSLNSL